MKHGAFHLYNECTNQNPKRLWLYFAVVFNYVVHLTQSKTEREVTSLSEFLSSDAFFLYHSVTHITFVVVINLIATQNTFVRMR